MSVKTKLFMVLWMAGFAGILSFLLVDLSALLANVTLPGNEELPTVTPALKILNLVQPTVILTVAVVVGVSLAAKVGLSSPATEAAVSGQNVLSGLKPQIIPGIVGGLAGGTAIVLTGLLCKPFLSPETISKMTVLGKALPLPTRIFYGGITEELLLRWGLMTLLVWISWRLFGKVGNKPKSAHFVAAMLISSVVFGIGHLPIAFLLVPSPSAVLVTYVIVANSVFGFIAGLLYWKKGLESAVIAHMLAHVVMLTATYFGANF